MPHPRRRRGGYLRCFRACLFIENILLDTEFGERTDHDDSMLIDEVQVLAWRGKGPVSRINAKIRRSRAS